jgi:hypothetical protein
MRTVVSNDQVAHIWAQQMFRVTEQKEARSHNGNFSFRGTVLYSYRTPIANFVADTTGKLVPLFTNARYSVTTQGKHMNPAHRAVNYRGFTVPSIGYSGYTGRTCDPDHAANLAYYVKAYEAIAPALKRKRDLYREPLEDLNRAATIARDYAATFGLPEPMLNTEEDARAVVEFRAARDARNNTPQKIRAKEQAAKRKAIKTVADLEGRYLSYRERNRLSEAKEYLAQRDPWLAIWLAMTREGQAHALTLELAADIEKWRNGDTSIRLPYDLAEQNTMLRIRGDNVETSRGATFPVKHAKLAFSVVKRCRDTGQAWHTNGHSVHLGAFQIDSIDAQGNVRAGCHLVKWPEIERAARQLGLMEE